MGLDSNPAQPRLGRNTYRRGANRRQIHPPLLPGLRQLDQDPAGARPAQSSAAAQQRIGALHRLNTERDTLLYHHRLPDIDATQGPRHRNSPPNILPGIGGDVDFTEDAGRREQPFENRVDALGRDG